MTADLSSLLKRRSFGRSTLRPFEEDGEVKGLAFLSAQDETSDIDEDGLSAKFLISTPSVDRALDVVQPKALNFADFEKNGIVLWNHGQNPMVPFPLGTSIDPETKKLAVEVTDRGVFAKCFFGKGVAQSEDMFKLVHQGIVKAASIHMVAPIEAKERAPGKKGGRPGYEITKANIAEWSLVDIPCNQDATRKAASSGRLLNEKLCDEVHEILKGMAASLPKAKMLGKGWSFEPEADEPKAEPKGIELSSDAKAALKVALDGAAEPAGAATLAGLHAQAKGMLATIKAVEVENPTVTECLADLAKTLDPFIATCEGGYSAAYPDGIGLDSTEAPDAEAVVKGITETLLAGGNRWLVKGALHRLQNVAAADNLRPGQAEALAGVVELVKRAVAEGEQAIAKGGSKPAEAPAIDPMQTELLKELKAMRAERKAMLDELADLKPYRPS
jgi:phage head maturation protease